MRAARICSAVILALVAVCIAPTGASRAAFPGRNGRIVFAASDTPPLPGFDGTGGANLDLFTVAPAGGGIVRITEGPADDSEPTWSPDGRAIAFTRSTNAFLGDIYVLDVATGRATNLTKTPLENEYAPSWAPSGKQIAFSKDGSGLRSVGTAMGADLYVMDADGDNVTKLTNHSQDESDAAWSPQGDVIAMTVGSYTGYRRVAYFGPREHALQLIGLNGKVVRTVVPKTPDLFISSPSWSPDGRRILFWDYSRDEIWVVNRDGSGLRNLSEELPESEEVTPSWSPDGRWIAFVVFNSPGQTQLYKMRSDGSEITPLIDIKLRVEVFGGTDWGPRP